MYENLDKKRCYSKIPTLTQQTFFISILCLHVSPLDLQTCQKSKKINHKPSILPATGPFSPQHSSSYSLKPFGRRINHSLFSQRPNIKHHGVIHQHHQLRQSPPPNSHGSPPNPPSHRYNHHQSFPLSVPRGPPLRSRQFLRRQR